MKTKAWVLTACVGLSAAAGPSQLWAEGQDSEIIRVSASLETPSNAIRGLPVLVEVRFTNLERVPRSEEELAQLTPADREDYFAHGRFKMHVSQGMYPAFDLFSEFQPVSWQVRDGAGAIVATAEIRPAVYRNYPDSSMNSDGLEGPVVTPIAPLLPGTTNAFVLDLSTLTGSLSPGEYWLDGELKRSAQFAGAKFGQHVIQLREISEQEAIAMDQAFGTAWRGLDLTSMRSWLQLDIKWHRVRSSLSSELLNRVWLYVFLNLAMRDDADMAPLGEVLDAAPGELTGLARALQFELLWEQGGADATAAIEAEVRTRFPELNWRIEEVKAGNGLLRQVDAIQRTELNRAK